MLLRLLCTTALLLSLTGAHAEPVALRIYTEELPPFNFKQPDGRLSGSSTEKVEAVLREAGLAYDIELTSWARAFEAARTQAACVYSTARTPEREAAFDWIGPLIRSDVVMLGLADKASAADTLEAARNARVGGYYGSASARFLMQRGFPVLMSTNHEVAFKNLLAGRLDYWVAMKDTGLTMVEKAGLKGKVVVRIPVNTVEMYLACNLQIDAGFRQKLHAAFRHLNANGSLRAVDRRYIN
ncbi:ABC transporter substrate-binding protein [Chitinimonas sp. BJYL2]|uniref:substrate-binding periplasmic protein n=1 Tax=Chitinimonas sp. BJYL2 TaxID=2976696 RepID=UPI0022B3BDC8|nr:transporter substrate-binding domain-containing protein [Chitinimonas sp. BJYL2]